MMPLPDEIWQQIFANFECVLPEDEWWTDQEKKIDHDLQKTLASICLVSRQFCCVAQPLLFRTILLRGGHSNKVRRQHQYAVLTRALAAFPDLGLETRTITLHDMMLPITPRLQSVLQDLLPSLDLPTAVRWHMEGQLECANLKFNKGIDISSFLLALMPRIRLVDFNYRNPRETGGSPVWTMSGRADVHPQLYITVFGHGGSQGLSRAHSVNFGLPNLEELRIRTTDHEHDPIYFEQFEAVLLHPNLKTLRLHKIDWRIDWIGDPMNTMKWPDEPCGVQFLELRECMVDASSLRHILTRFTRLRTLIIHLGGAFPPVAGIHRRVHLDGFGSALRDLGQNLLELSLDASACGVNGHLGPLREMRSLRRLRVVLDDLVVDLGNQPEGILTIADLLPLSIETVRFHCEEESWEGFGRGYDYVHEAVRKLLELGHMPSLRQVSIEGYYTIEEWEDELDEPVTGWDTTTENDSRTVFGVTFTKRD